VRHSDPNEVAVKHKDTKLGGSQSTFSRRNLLKGAAALAAAASVPEAFGQQAAGEMPGSDLRSIPKD
jgi:hypothetical protein